LSPSKKLSLVEKPIPAYETSLEKKSKLDKSLSEVSNKSGNSQDKKSVKT